MIKRTGSKILQHRKGEEKTKHLCSILHNPEAKSPAKREPYICIDGVRLTASELSQIASELTAWEQLSYWDKIHG